MENTPLESPNQQPTAPKSGLETKNKMTTPIIVVIIVLVVGGLYFGYQKWQAKRIANNYLKQLGIADSSLFGSNINKIAEQMAKEEAAQAKKTPAQKFAEAETLVIADSNQRSTAESINKIIADTFGDSKITGFTSGYMGMNSDSGIVQFTIPKTLSMNDVNGLKENLENNNFEIIVASQQNDSASIMAQRVNTSYTFGFNTGDQEIMVVIISM